MKYIGSLPGKNDQYLGLELEDEGLLLLLFLQITLKKMNFSIVESKHDGVYQGQRLFQW